MKKTMILFVMSALTLAALPLCAQISVSPGARLPDVEADWIRAPKAMPPAAPSLRRIEIIVFTDASMRNSAQVFRMVETLEEKYKSVPGFAVRFRTVDRNDEAKLRGILNASPVPYALAVGSDRKNATFNNFAIASLPFSFVGLDGAIVWSGSPVDIEYVADSVIAGKHTGPNFAKMFEYRRDMLAALQAGLPDVAAQSADKALALDPADMIAIQTKLYAFDMKGRSADAAAFLQKQIAAVKGYHAKLQFLLLDNLARSGNAALWKRAALNAAAGAESARDRVNLAAWLLERSPVNHMPLREIGTLLAKAEQQISAMKDADSLRADCMELTARCRYFSGKIPQSVAVQANVVELRRKIASPLLSRSEEALNFYREVQTVSGEK